MVSNCPRETERERMEIRYAHLIGIVKKETTILQKIDVCMLYEPFLQEWNVIWKVRNLIRFQGTCEYSKLDYLLLFVMLYLQKALLLPTKSLTIEVPLLMEKSLRKYAQQLKKRITQNSRIVFI